MSFKEIRGLLTIPHSNENQCVTDESFVTDISNTPLNFYVEHYLNTNDRNEVILGGDSLLRPISITSKYPKDTEESGWKEVNIISTQPRLFANSEIIDIYPNPSIEYLHYTLSLNYEYKTISGMSAGDIVYINNINDEVTYIPSKYWKSSLGDPFGVIVIPQDFLPDGQARMIGLEQINQKYRFFNGEDDNMNGYFGWRNMFPGATASNLINDNFTACTESSTPLASDYYCDKSNSFPCPVDSSSAYEYSASGDYVPSPYRDNSTTINDKFIMTLNEGENAFSRFIGKGDCETYLMHTKISNYPAIKAAMEYTNNNHEGSDGFSWYLPTIGEMIVMFSRIKKINEALVTLGLTPFMSNGKSYATVSDADDYQIWSLLEHTIGDTITVTCLNAYRESSYNILPFTMVYL